MKKIKIKSLIIIACLMILPAIFLSKFKDTFTKNLPSLAVWKDNYGDTRHIPPFTLINQNNDTITEEYYKDKIYISNFIFTTCQSQCKEMTFYMKHLQQKLSKYDNVYFLSHTVNPTYDTPQILKEYANRWKDELGADLKKWNFVTGDRDEIYALARAYLSTAGIDTMNIGHQGFIHQPYFTLVDPQGRIRSGFYKDDNKGFRVYDGTSASDIKELVRDVGVLVSEIKRNDRKKR